MVHNFTEVKVVSQSKKTLLKEGTGTSSDTPIKLFACGKFGANRPVHGDKYDITATDAKGIVIRFAGECDFSGETSQFTRKGPEHVGAATAPVASSLSAGASGPLPSARG